MSFSSPVAYRLTCNASRLEVLAIEFDHERILIASQMLESLSNAQKDRLCTDLMGLYAQSKSQEAFGLLYEFSQETVLSLVRFHLRRSFFPIDAYDVMQEVFVNIYKYPNNFDDTKDAAFKNWVHSIARNTTLKVSRRAQHNQAVSLICQQSDGTESALEIEDLSVANPHEQSSFKEGAENLAKSWMLYLHFYMKAFKTLSPQEKRALHLVEVDNMAYRDASKILDLSVENFKMRIFRARRKIYNTMRLCFAGGADASIINKAPRSNKSMLVGRVAKEEKGELNA
ncbi:MAG: RNA polymerase sigma factor [Planctomycetes bacterium]|nr:RNA polymerase sigma factor [Planctomycetota bacterium]